MGKYKSIIVFTIFTALFILAYSFYLKSDDNTVVPIETDNGEQEQTQVTINIFAHNQNFDMEANENNISCDPQYVMPLERTITVAADNELSQVDYARYAVEKLITEELSSEETALGYVSEFPHEGFELVELSENNGTVGVEFTEVPGFTTGGSCRIAILRAQIEKTIKQFYSDNIEVEFVPESIFQP